MMSVLPNGGGYPEPFTDKEINAALDDVSATEWREIPVAFAQNGKLLHSMMSVLPNGGISMRAGGEPFFCCTR